MNYHAKRKLIQHSMYIVLAMIVCSVMCLTIVAFVSAHRSQNKQNPPLTNDPPAVNGNNDTPKPPEHEDSNDTNKPSEDNPDQSTGSEDEPSYVLPADGYVLKGFSIDLPVWSLTMEDYRAHTGIDVSAACGSAVYAMTGGVITDISEDPLMGMSITIVQNDSNTALYQNLALDLPEGIAEGVTVTAGQIIAAVGDTAMIEQCETDHLHLELFSPTGDRINPETMLDFSKVPGVDSGNE
ncbi:MAG: M23 family metallopeptidase [Ruminococcaceae bacterium]|nr:M23 family metallopeptidase [Oscillospiraceae bacterium]